MEWPLLDLKETMAFCLLFSYKHLFNSAILDLNAEDSTFADDSDTESGTSMNNSDDHSSASDSEVPVSEACDDDDDDDDGEEEEKTINEAVEQTLNVQPLATHSVPEGPQCGPHFKLSRGEELYAYEEELQLVKEKKFICSLGLFLDLFVKRCPVLFCNNSPNVKHHFVGPTLVVHTTCQAGHRYSFASCHEVNGMYVNNLQCASALLLSGNNYSKISRMAEFLNLNLISESTYYQMQRLYLVPAVEEWWCWMRGELVKEFEGQKIVVGGDGQCDSPGFSAKNLCYFLMEITTRYILEVEVRDKRHVCLTSTKMEKEALKNALERLKSVLDVVELMLQHPSKNLLVST